MMNRGIFRNYSDRVVSWYNLTAYKAFFLVLFILGMVLTMFIVNAAANISSFWTPVKAYNHVLQDVGCDFFNVTKDGSFAYYDVIDISMIVFCAVSIFFIVINRLAIFIGLKVMAVLIITYCLRCSTLMVTSLPDSWNLGLRTIQDTFSSLSRDRGGDLIFSGHTLLLCTFAHCWSSFYMISDSFAVHFISGLIAWGIVGTLITFIVVSRVHYTIDVLIGLYITSGVWWSVDYFLIKYFESPVCKLKFRERQLPPMISSSADDHQAVPEHRM